MPAVIIGQRFPLPFTDNLKQMMHTAKVLNAGFDAVRNEANSQEDQKIRSAQ